jgi:hypothetical protein
MKVVWKQAIAKSSKMLGAKISVPSKKIGVILLISEKELLTNCS